MCVCIQLATCEKRFEIRRSLVVGPELNGFSGSAISMEGIGVGLLWIKDQFVDATPVIWCRPTFTPFN